jgi:hypothetical protein
MVPQDLNPPLDTQTQNRWADWATAIFDCAEEGFHEAEAR